MLSICILCKAPYPVQHWERETAEWSSPAPISCATDPHWRVHCSQWRACSQALFHIPSIAIYLHQSHWVRGAHMCCSMWLCVHAWESVYVCLRRGWGTGQTAEREIWRRSGLTAFESIHFSNHNNQLSAKFLSQPGHICNYLRSIEMNYVKRLVMDDEL